MFAKSARTGLLAAAAVAFVVPTTAIARTPPLTKAQASRAVTNFIYSAGSAGAVTGCRRLTLTYMLCAAQYGGVGHLSTVLCEGVFAARRYSYGIDVTRRSSYRYLGGDGSSCRL